MIVSAALDSNNPLKYKEQQEQIESLMGKYSGYGLTFSLKYDSILNFENEPNTSSLIGLFFAVFFSVIGITNTINSIANHTFSNRIAYARMQAAGMTRKQLTRELTLNNMKTYGLALLVFIPLEFLTLMAVLPGFRTEMFAASVILVILAVLAILALTSRVLTGYLNKKTIAQRLREIE